MRIGVDVDGVLADFDIAYANLLSVMTGRTIPTDSDPEVWDWPELHVTAEEEDAAWELIATRPFWDVLPEDRSMTPDSWRRLAALNDAHDVYFITARLTPHARAQTSFWLYDRGLVNVSVVCAADKGLVARSLRLEAFLDDLPENVLAVREESPDTKVFMRMRRFNASFPWEDLVHDLDGFITVLDLGL